MKKLEKKRSIKNRYKIKENVEHSSLNYAMAAIFLLMCKREYLPKNPTFIMNHHLIAISL